MLAKSFLNQAVIKGTLAKGAFEWAIVQRLREHTSPSTITPLPPLTPPTKVIPPPQC